MHKNKWQLQEAKNQFSKVINSALTDGPQTVTRHGKEAVVVLSYQEYKKLVQKRESLVDFFQKSPLKGVKLDLKRSKDLPRDLGSLFS